MQVDVMQVAIVQYRDRPGRPVYCVEQLIEGDYIKYNSNSGFVRGDDLMRNTPQAFSHFTFELTRGNKICVDVQGVGDIYTDPQVRRCGGAHCTALAHTRPRAHTLRQRALLCLPVGSAACSQRPVTLIRLLPVGLCACVWPIACSVGLCRCHCADPHARRRGLR